MEKVKKRRKKHRYHWSFNRMHPVLQGICFAVLAAAWLFLIWGLSWGLYFMYPEAF